jgi:hypothetical protein
VREFAYAKRTFSAMPGRGKAAVLIIWVSCALAAIPLVIGLSHVFAGDLGQPENLVLLGVFLALAVYGGFLVALSMLLIKGKNWARIALIVLYAISIAAFVLGVLTSSMSGSDIRNLIVAVPMLFLLTAEPVKHWCSPWAAPHSHAAEVR